MAKTVRFTIDKEGNVVAEINGVKGPACMDYLDLIEQLTEGKIVETEKTREFYQHVGTEQSDSIENKA